MGLLRRPEVDLDPWYPVAAQHHSAIRSSTFTEETTATLHSTSHGQGACNPCGRIRFHGSERRRSSPIDDLNPSAGPLRSAGLPVKAYWLWPEARSTFAQSDFHAAAPRPWAISPAASSRTPARWVPCCQCLRVPAMAWRSWALDDARSLVQVASSASSQVRARLRNLARSASVSGCCAPLSSPTRGGGVLVVASR